MKAILILIDSIAGSKEYMAYAINLAAKLKRKAMFLYLFDHVNIPVGSLGYAETVAHLRQKTYQSQIEEAEKEIDSITRELTADISNMPEIGYRVETGTPHEAINKILVSEEADMVMLEEYVGGRPSEFVRESNIEIIKNTHCPVWLIPPDIEYQSFNRIVYATDYLEEDIPALKKLSDIATVYNAQITALHITENIDFEERIKSSGYGDMLKEKVGYGKVDMKLVAEEKGTGIAENILKFASHSEADLIVLMKEDKSFLERIFTSSMTRKLSKQTMFPVLVYHEK
jgi:nucleotide-binding universal stress UspA family protein